MSHTISAPVERLDAREKSRGEARYLADLHFPGVRKCRFLRSPAARGTVRVLQAPALPEGYAFVCAADIPTGGRNSVQMITSDWRVFADGDVRFLGEPLGLLVGPHAGVLEELAKAFTIEIDEVEPAFTEEDGLACVGGPSFGTDNLFADHTIVKGSPEDAFESARLVVTDTFRTGVQEHVYMEPQSLVVLEEGGRLTIYISTQCPFYVREGVSSAVGRPVSEVVVKQTVTGGGFGGKEHYPDTLAAALSVAVLAVGGPIEFVMERGEDMLFSAKRHPSTVRYRAALDENNRVVALDADLTINAGAYQSGSGVVLQRAMFSAAGVYDIPNVRIRGRAVCTNTVPNDAFRGFGAPQALFAAEGLMTHIARRIGVDEVDFRRSHLVTRGSITVTNGTIREEVILPRIIDHVLDASDYRGKDAACKWGGGRGIGLSIFKHGSAFTGSGERDIIKAEIRLRKHADGRPEIIASTVEIGQGALTTLRKIVATELDIPVADVLYHDADTSRVPDSGPTCASRSVAVVGYLIEQAARRLKSRMNEPGEIEVVQRYEHPPELVWDQETYQGDAYPSYSWGANVVEVEVDRYTHEVRVVGVWTAYDVGRAIDSIVVQGQIEGGASQGLGYATLEKMELKDGRYQQVSMADYMIPTSLDFPAIESKLFDNPYPYGPSGAKGAGEVVFDGLAPALASAVEKAIGGPVHELPVTPERIAELLRGRRETDDSIRPEWIRAVDKG